MKNKALALVSTIIVIGLLGLPGPTMAQSCGGSTPTPTCVPTATPTGTLPGIVQSPAPMTWIPVHFPTPNLNGIFGQADLYAAPTAVGLTNTVYNLGFSLSNEVDLANVAISMYKTANTHNAVNLLLWLFLVFGFISILFALIKKIGK